MSTTNTIQRQTNTSAFSTYALLLIPVGVAINFIGGQLNDLLKLPLYLDTIGTLLSAILAGPIIGLTTGVLTNIVAGIINPVNFAFIPVNLVVGLIAGYLSKKDFFLTPLKIAISIVIITLVSIIVSAPILVFAFGGLTGNGASVIASVLLASGQNIWTAVIGTNGVFNFLDRILSILVVFAIIRVLPKKTLIQFQLGEKYIK